MVVAVLTINATLGGAGHAGEGRRWWVVSLPAPRRQAGGQLCLEHRAR